MLPSAVVTMTEAELQECVIDTAHLFGWKVAHFRAAMTKHGWRTPVAADGKGFPDCVLVRDRVIFAELKSSTGRISPDQSEWMISLRAAGAEYHLWAPDDWQSGAIEAVLRRHS